MKDSPVNILSTRRLAEQFPDVKGQPGVVGTSIHSKFNTHVLTWNRKKYCKSFSTACSDLPKCLFNTGYSRFQTYTSCVGKLYNDPPSQAFASGVKPSKLFEGETVTSKPKRIVGDLEGLTCILNDGSKAKELVTFKGVAFVDKTEQHCKVQQKDGYLALICPELLHFIKNTDIASIPQMSEDYCRECLSVDPTQIKHILNPKPMSPLQEELMQYRTCLHHLPFPQLILLAEKERSQDVWPH